MNRIACTVVLGASDRGGAGAPVVRRPPKAQRIPAAFDRYAGYYAMESGALKVSIDVDGVSDIEHSSKARQ